MITQVRATIADLYRVPENRKAEIMNGELVRMSPTGSLPSWAATSITISMRVHGETHGDGYGFGDNVGFVVKLPNRDSFSPDAAWYVGEVRSMKFLEGAPRFAAEVRSEVDYGQAAERAIRQKIADYFAAGTAVVWDVDLLNPEVIKVYRATDPDNPTIYRRNDTAEAEPAVPGWTFKVEKLFM